MRLKKQQRNIIRKSKRIERRTKENMKWMKTEEKRGVTRGRREKRQRKGGKRSEKQGEKRNKKETREVTENGEK